MKVLITGGAGFIGSHLVDRLVSAGTYEVVVVDSLVSGSLENLKGVLDKIEFTQLDVSHRLDADLFKGVDAVVHLAALADIVPSIESPVRYYQTNVTGTLNVLEACKEGGVKRVIYGASSSCYGIPEVYPTPETSPLRPEYPYALTKKMGEDLVMHWGKVYKIEAVSLRFFNVYGRRARTRGAYGAVFGVFLAQKLAGQPLTVVGNGEQQRDFTHVSDIAAGIELAMHASGASGQIINLGSGEAVSINHIVRLLDHPSINVPKRPGEPQVTLACIDRASEILDYVPSVPINSGVSELLANIAEFNGAPVWTKEAIAGATQKWFEALG